MNLFKDKANSFLNSYYYPLLVFSFALISHTFSVEILGIVVLALSASIGFIVCDDLKFLISPLIFFIFMFSQKSVESGTFYTTAYIVAIIIFSIFVLALLIVHFVLHKKQVDFKAPIKSQLFVGILCLCASFLLNGFFNFDEYNSGNIAFAFALIVSLALIFFLFTTSLKPNEDLRNYLFFVLYLVSILLILQFYFSFIHQFEFSNGSLNKESILFGWGMWNNMGGMLTFLLPVHFYFATTVKKYGWIFYLSGAVTYLTIALSLSRSSLLVSTVLIIACAIISCLYGENKKTNRIITVAIAVVGIVGIIVLWDKISAVLSDYLSRGLDDNGRFEIYKKGIDNFCENPIFGGGFFSVDAQEHQFVLFMPDRYHNTIIQMLGACGIIGFLAYSLHRVQTLMLLWKKRSLFTAFCSLCLAGLLLTSLLDNHFFNIYPCFTYVLILTVVEKCENDYINQNR